MDSVNLGQLLDDYGRAFHEAKIHSGDWEVGHANRTRKVLVNYVEALRARLGEVERNYALCKRERDAAIQAGLAQAKLFSEAEEQLTLARQAILAVTSDLWEVAHREYAAAPVSTERMVEALRFYANPVNHEDDEHGIAAVTYDKGKVARQALSPQPQEATPHEKRSVSIAPTANR